MSPSPKELAEAVVRYADEHPAWSQLVNEDRTFEYSERNFPIRVLLGRFTSMQRDRLLHVEIDILPARSMRRPTLGGALGGGQSPPPW
jgi:hypothetical protein